MSILIAVQNKIKLWIQNIFLNWMTIWRFFKIWKLLNEEEDKKTLLNYNAKLTIFPHKEYLFTELCAMYVHESVLNEEVKETLDETRNRPWITQLCKL